MLKPEGGMLLTPMIGGTLEKTTRAADGKLTTDCLSMVRFKDLEVCTISMKPPQKDPVCLSPLSISPRPWTVPTISSSLLGGLQVPLSCSRYNAGLNLAGTSLKSVCIAGTYRLAGGEGNVGGREKGLPFIPILRVNLLQGQSAPR